MSPDLHPTFHNFCSQNQVIGFLEGVLGALLALFVGFIRVEAFTKGVRFRKTSEIARRKIFQLELRHNLPHNGARFPNPRPGRYGPQNPGFKSVFFCLAQDLF